MKLVPLILLAAAVGAGLGVASAYVGVTPVEKRFAPPPTDGAVPAPTPGVTQSPAPAFPQADVSELEFDFGALQRGASDSHEFTITNAGDAPLVLEVGPKSCKCTAAELDDDSLAPGESTTFRVDWVAKTPAGAFSQTATVLSNDPRRRRIEFRIVGRIVEATGLEPKELLIGQIAYNDTASASVYLATFDGEPMEATVRMAEGTRKPGLFEVSVEQVAPEEIPIPAATGGVRIDLTAGPGLPTGLIGEWVVVETNIEEVGTVQIPVVGAVRGDVTIHGRGWSSHSGVLNFGSVESSEGNKTKLLISFKGDDAADARATLDRVDPEWLEVGLEEPKPTRDGKTRQMVSVRIPPGRPAEIRSGGEQGDEDARILLRTNLESTPEVELRVRYIIAE